jgi:hypothetical protein
VDADDTLGLGGRDDEDLHDSEVSVHEDKSGSDCEELSCTLTISKVVIPPVIFFVTPWLPPHQVSMHLLHVHMSLIV